MRPDHIPAGRAPGGIVLRIYRMTDDRLLRETRLASFVGLGDAAAADAAAVAAEDHPVVLVPYDGDSGAKMALPPLMVEHFRYLGIPPIGDDVPGGDHG